MCQVYKLAIGLMSIVYLCQLPEPAGDRSPSASARASKPNVRDREEARGGGEDAFEALLKPRPAEARNLAALATSELGAMALLGNSAVQKDLGLSRTQVDSLSKIVLQFRERRLKQVDITRDRIASAIERKERYDRQQDEAEMARISSQEIRAALETLHPKQRRRVDQLILQAQGPLLAVMSPALVEELGITPDQQQAANNILEAMERAKARLVQERIKTLHGAVGDGSPGRAVERGGEPPDGAKPDEVALAASKLRISKDEYMRKLEIDKKLEQTESDAVRAIGRLLTPAQRRSYNRIVGEPFDFTKMTQPAAAHR